MRTREGAAVAKAKGKLRGKQPKLSTEQQRELVRMYGTGEYTIADLAGVFAVSRTTVYRTLRGNSTSAPVAASASVWYMRWSASSHTVETSRASTLTPGSSTRSRRSHALACSNKATAPSVWIHAGRSRTPAADPGMPDRRSPGTRTRR
jgi:transposase-like protein